MSQKDYEIIAFWFLDCKTAVFFANASDGPYSNERPERVKKGRGRMVRVRLARFTLEDNAYGASRLPKTTVLQSIWFYEIDFSRRVYDLE